MKYAKSLKAIFAKCQTNREVRDQGHPHKSVLDLTWDSQLHLPLVCIHRYSCWYQDFRDEVMPSQVNKMVNGIQPVLILSFTPVLFLLWRAKMSSKKGLLSSGTDSNTAKLWWVHAEVSFTLRLFLQLFLFYHILGQWCWILLSLGWLTCTGAFYSRLDVILALFDWHGVAAVDVMHMGDGYLHSRRCCAFYAEYFHIVDSVVA